MELIPFSHYEDEDYNDVYKFIFTSDRKKSFNLRDCYVTKIKIDGLNDDLIIKENCKDCNGFKFKKNCKHLKKSKEILSKYEINYREDE